MKAFSASNLFFLFLIVLTISASIIPGIMAKDVLPNYQFLTLLLGGIVACLALVLVIFRRKVGVILYPISIFIQIVLLTKGDLLYTLSLVFVLFLFVGYGLVFLIPDWDKLR